MMHCKLAVAGEYTGSARAQPHQSLQQLSGGVSEPQDIGAMRLFLFDCTDGSSSSSKIMLRLRRSVSAFAPDISLGLVTIYCRPLPPHIPAPPIDVEKASRVAACICHTPTGLHSCFNVFFQVRALLSQLQQTSMSSSAAPIIVHPQAQQLLQHMQVSDTAIPRCSCTLTPSLFTLFRLLCDQQSAVTLPVRTRPSLWHHHQHHQHHQHRYHLLHFCRHRHHQLQPLLQQRCPRRHQPLSLELLLHSPPQHHRSN